MLYIAGSTVYVFVVVREYDVPYHVRVSIDLNITVSRWYLIVIGGTAVTPDIQLREDLLDLPVCLMLCSVFVSWSLTYFRHAADWSISTPWAIKKRDTFFFTAIYNNELRNKNLLNFSPYLKSVAALPCET